MRILPQAKLGKQRFSKAARTSLPPFLLSALAVLVLTACSAPVLKATPEALALHRAILYLHHEYDPTLGLLRESPTTAPDKHWLFTDNWLAAQALSCAGERAFAAQVRRHLASYGAFQHGLIEALAGTVIPWPPYTPSQVELQPGVWLERRDQQPMADWQAYTDLALYGALRQYNTGSLAQSRQRYHAAVQPFDGVGFPDLAFDHRYTTYKLALAIYVAHRLHEPITPALVQAFLAKQRDNGGFVTLYDETGQPQGDSNTETTAYAVLALTGLVEPLSGDVSEGCLGLP